MQARELGKRQSSSPFHDTNDVYNFEYKLKNALSLLERAKISPQDKQKILDFVDLLKALRVSKGRIAKYILHLKVIGENLGLQFEQATRKDIEHFVASWLYEQKYSAETTADYIMVLKRFYKYLRNGNVDKDTPFPEEVRWLKKTIKPNERKEPEFLTPQEVEALIAAAETIRDKCMIAVQFDGGFRPGEHLGINVGDVHLDEKGARILVRGKTGERVVRVISCAGLLAQYLETHQFRDQPEAPLWLTESTNYRFQRLGWTRWNKILKKAWRDAQIKKTRLYSRMLRHGSATESARFLSDSELKVKHGWTMGSRMPAVYVHLSGKDLDDKLVGIYTGKEVKPKGPEFAPIICPRCKASCTPGLAYCGHCGTPLDQKSISTETSELQMMWKELQRLQELIVQGLNKK
ncbi:MAG: tyrosine-type recombinase/integrase [Nitrososphaerales archaeon]